MKERDLGYELVEQQQNQIQQLTESVAYYEQFRPSVKALCESYSTLEAESNKQRETIEGQRLMKEVYENNIENLNEEIKNMREHNGSYHLEIYTKLMNMTNLENKLEKTEKLLQKDKDEALLMKSEIEKLNTDKKQLDIRVTELVKDKKELLERVQKLGNSKTHGVKLAEELQVELDQKTITLNMYKENVSRFQDEKELHLKEMTDLLKVCVNLDEIKDNKTFLSILI